MRLLLPALAVACLLPLAACGDSGKDTSTAKSAEELATLPPPAEPSQDAKTRCRTSGLKLTVEGGGGAAGGNFWMALTLTNTSKSTCTMVGFPGLTLHRAAAKGAKSADLVADRTYEAYVPLPKTPVVVTLKAGEKAEFGIAGAGTVDGGKQNDPGSTSVDVIPPDESTALSISAQLPMPDSGLAISVVEPAGCLQEMTCKDQQG